ncbi:MAG: ABC transporter ATP-binding protein [Thermodesulfobacteriota bacterium]
MIELAEVMRSFQVGTETVRGLDRVSLAVARGEYLAITGPSGSGKSTLLHTIGLLDRPDQGRYRLHGQDVTRLDDDARAHLRRQAIGFVFQFFHLVPRLTAAENVELPLVLAGVPPRLRRERVARLLARLGLADRAGHRPDELSGGQRQRVAIARAAVTEPEILLADEPTGNLDRAAGREVIAILEELNAAGLTLLVVTHDPELASRARRQLRLEDGRIIADSAPCAP